MAADGIRLIGEYYGTVITIAADNVYIRYFDIDGDFRADASGYHSGGAGTGLVVSGNSISVLDCRIHGVADDASAIYDSTDVLFKGNRIYGMYGQGTDNDSGPCYNGHSDGIELANVADSVFDGNYVLAPYREGGMVNAALYFADWMTSAATYNRNLLFRNNVFYRDISFPVYIIQADNIRFYNNTVWGNLEGGAGWGGGLTIGEDVSRLVMKNNILLFVRFAHWNPAVTWDASRYSGSHNFFGTDARAWPLQTGDILASDPGFLSIPGAGSTSFYPNAAMSSFMLKPGSRAIDSGMSVEDNPEDALGARRPEGSGYDIGAFEFQD